MKRSDFYYDLPEELIAQTPVEPRDSSRLMRIDRKTGKIEHSIFRDLPSFLKKGDLLIVNDSRVIPARLYGQKKETGGAIEFLLLEQKRTRIGKLYADPRKKQNQAHALYLATGF